MVKEIDYGDATRILFAKKKPEDLARVLGVSAGYIKNGRHIGSSRQSPPKTWRDGVIVVAKERIVELQDLIASVEQSFKAQDEEIRLGHLRKARPDLNESAARELLKAGVGDNA